MAARRFGAPQSTRRLFATFALITLLPVLLLGAVLAASYRREARRRGVAEGRQEASLVARAAVEPLLAGHDLGAGLSPDEGAALRRLVGRTTSGHDVLRLRLEDLSGRVVYSEDGSGFADKPEDEALQAAHGEIVTRLTRLNADSNDRGPKGVDAVEAYRPLYGGSPARQVGVLEVYLPYAPISHDVTDGLNSLYRDLALGLAALYLAVFTVSALLSRGLRRQLALNAFLAEHDALTELPNRTLFHRRAEEAVSGATAGAQNVAIAIIDLDRFREVNDTLGHHNGDRLLTELGLRLAAFTQRGNTVARLGGDEFGVILRDVADPDAALRQLRNVIELEVEVSGVPLTVEASVGYVLAPDDGEDIDELLQHADMAMYVAKAGHTGVARYDRRQDHYDPANLGLIAELRHAIDDGQLVLHYQPKVALGDGHVEAVEALVRWQHPSLGLLAPDRFIPLAEQTDLIDKLTYWVVESALADLQDLGARAAGLSVAVNVSARNLARPDFASRVVDILDRDGVPAGRLIVEITETALLVDPARAATILADLANAGARVSIDDFGRGQTSLGYLSELPVHELKIDRIFVADMLVNPAHAAIVRSIVDLGHNLSLRVVAEGVETDAVLSALRDTGCDVAQGFLLARPMAVGALGEWLRGPGSHGGHLSAGWTSAGSAPATVT